MRIAFKGAMRFFLAGGKAFYLFIVSLFCWAVLFAVLMGVMAGLFETHSPWQENLALFLSLFLSIPMVLWWWKGRRPG